MELYSRRETQGKNILVCIPNSLVCIPNSLVCIPNSLVCIYSWVLPRCME